MSQRNVVVDGSAFVANVLAMVVSLVVNKSAGWAFIHGGFGIFYLLYALVAGDLDIFNDEIKALLTPDKPCETTVVATPVSEDAAELPPVRLME